MTRQIQVFSLKGLFFLASFLGRALKEWVREEREGQHFSNFSFMGGKGVDFYFRKYGSPFKAVLTQTRGPWISPHGESAGVRASSSSILD